MSASFFSLRNLLFVILGSFLLLALTELSLRGIASYLLVQNYRANHIHEQDQQAFRILTLGESTTADYRLGDESIAWPRQLEAEMRALGYNVRVYNEGRPGISSLFIVSRLDVLLDHYRPHLVITMMGVNDSMDLVLKTQNSFLSQFKIFKLVWWSRQAVAHLMSRYIFDQDWKTLDRHTRNQVRQAARSYLSNPLSGMGQFKTIYKKSQYNPHTMAEFHYSLFEHYKLQGFPSPYLDYLEHEMERVETVPLALSMYLLVMDFAGLCDKALKRIDRALSKGVFVTTTMRARILNCSNQVPIEKLQKYLAISVEKLAPGHSESIPTARHYQQLYQTLNRAQTGFIAMQYPTLSLSQLRGYFDPSAGTLSDKHLISNQDNFRQALIDYDFEEIFMDRFAGEWGHTTRLGHQLIAEQVIAHLLSHWSSELTAGGVRH